jgi:hypothetical protein
MERAEPLRVCATRQERAGVSREAGPESLRSGVEGAGAAAGQLPGCYAERFSSWADAQRIADSTVAAIMGNSEVINRKHYEQVLDGSRRQAVDRVGDDVFAGCSQAVEPAESPISEGTVSQLVN